MRNKKRHNRVGMIHFDVFLIVDYDLNWLDQKYECTRSVGNLDITRDTIQRYFGS